MKKILLLMTGALLVASCQQDVVYEVDYNITLDGNNTYYAGDPVKFNISGEVDNLLFYSGETGHSYQFKDRYSVLVDDIKDVSLKIDYEGQWGYKGGLDVYITNKFEGLKGNDQEADRAIISKMIGLTEENASASRDQMQVIVDAAMAENGWTKLAYEEGDNKVKTSQTYDLDPSMFDNVSVAFHFHPINDGKSAQRSYLVSGNFILELDGMAPMAMSFKNLSFTSFMMNKEIEDPYQINKGKGSVNFTNANCDIFFQGHDKGALPYALDGWVISTPNKFAEVPVSNDKGTVIKNLQNYMHSYEYVWNTPGTYKVVFLGRNENYAAASEDVQEFTITILEKPEE